MVVGKKTQRYSTQPLEATPLLSPGCWTLVGVWRPGMSLGAHLCTWLHCNAQCALFGHLETAKYLLLQGAHINTQIQDKRTPLHRPSNIGKTDIVQLLLQCGADQEIRNEWGQTAEELAKNDETRAVFSKYKEKNAKSQNELLQQAIDEKNYDVAIILIF